MANVIYVHPTSTQVLLTALIDTMKKSFVNVMLILVFIMFLFAIFGYYLFGYVGGDERNWGDLGTAFLTLFSFVTVSQCHGATFLFHVQTEYINFYEKFNNVSHI